MTRPTKPRRIHGDPRARHFKPQGVPLRDLKEIRLEHDELEALRLADLEGLSHEDVGAGMEVSRATAGRILANARAKVARALIEGLAIRIDVDSAWSEGGYTGAGHRNRRRRHGMPGEDRTGPQGQGPKTGRGLGRCNSKDDEQKTPDESGRGQGQGLGRGQGGPGRGQGRGGGSGGAGRGRGRGRGAGRGMRNGRGGSEKE